MMEGSKSIYWKNVGLEEEDDCKEKKSWQLAKDEELEEDQYELEELEA